MVLTLPSRVLIWLRGGEVWYIRVVLFFCWFGLWPVLLDDFPGSLFLWLDVIWSLRDTAVTVEGKKGKERSAKSKNYSKLIFASLVWRFDRAFYGVCRFSELRVYTSECVGVISRNLTAVHSELHSCWSIRVWCCCDMWHLWYLGYSSVYTPGWLPVSLGGRGV